MSTRVLHLIGGGEIGGAEQNVLYLLSGCNPEKVNPSLACLVKGSPFAALARSQGIPAQIFPMRFPLDLSPLIPLVRFCRKNKIDLLHCHGFRANLLGRIAARLVSLPCISTFHSRPENDYTSSWKGRLVRFLDNLTLCWTSGLITVSADLEKMAFYSLKHKGLSLPVKTIPNGCPALDFSGRTELRTSFRKKMGVSESCMVIGTIGRLHPVKGHIFLIEALHLLAKEFSDFHFLLIGEGPLHAQLEELLISYQLPHTMPGYLPAAWQALPAMDLFVLPSLSEGMGLVLLEAAQAGIPIIASRVGGIPELLTDNTDALLVNPADPVDLALSCNKLLQDSALSRSLAENAGNKAAMYTIEKMASSTIEFYDSILQNNN